MKRSLTLAVVLMLLGITIYAQENAVKIGEQVWMKYDLDVVRFINGDPLLEAKTIDEFSAAGDKQKPACYKTATGHIFTIGTR
jgi:Fibrobacter succinogenes major domain (Fib_succ_major).